MSKRYYARQIDIEWFDCDYYFGEDDAVYNKMWIGGNREFITFNNDLREDVVRHLEDCKYDLDVVRDDNDVHEFETEEDYIKELHNTIDSYFSKENKESFIETEYLKLIDLVDKFYTCESREEDDLICEVLEIIYSEPFTTGMFRGCCQGDWINYICPKSLSDEYLDYVEAVLFGTGTEFSITCESYEEEPDFSEVDTYCDYTYLYKDQDIKEWLAKNIGCSVDDIVIQLIEDSYTTKHYNYRTI